MTSSDTHPTDSAPVVRLGSRGPELVTMRWGFEPNEGSEPLINVRAETAELSCNRCLVPATEVDFFTGHEHRKHRWQVRLKGEPLFFFAGLWREASASWPESYAIITIEASPDLAELTERQPAVIRPADAAAWLTDERRAAELLRPLARGSFEIGD